MKWVDAIRNRKPDYQQVSIPVEDYEALKAATEKHLKQIGEEVDHPVAWLLSNLVSRRLRLLIYPHAIVVNQNPSYVPSKNKKK